MAEQYPDPSDKWAGTGRKQRQAQRQRARGAGMGELGESFGEDRGMHGGMAGAAAGMQGDMYGQLGGVSQGMGALAGRYGDLASGQGPSLARAQLQGATQQNVANQMSMAAAGRGGNLAAQARQASTAGAGAQMAATQQASQLRAQEQLGAMAGQAGALQGQAGVMGQRAGLASDMRGQSAQQEMGYAGMQLEHQLGHRGQDIQAQGDRRKFASDLTGSIAGGVGSIIGAVGSLSDERAKRNVKDGGLAAVQTLDEIGGSKRFEYKPGFGPPGERVGVMAQDLEKTPAGRAIVHDTPQGKAVDVGGMSSLALAASAEQQKEIDELKKALTVIGGGMTGYAESDPSAGKRFAQERSAAEEDRAKRRRAGSSFKPMGLAGVVRNA